MKRTVFFALASVCATGLLLLMIVGPTQAAILADHTTVSEFDQIPTSAFTYIRENFNMYYGHTSHGSQIISGLEILENTDSQLYDIPRVHEAYGDLGHNGDITWSYSTRDWLEGHPECNLVMWSWCGGCSDNTEVGIAAYLAAMDQLEIDYPEVSFVYMTGHLDGSGPTGNLYQRNNQIRQYCGENNKILFDFADIESWDPSGNYYPDEDDGCAWCSDWCSENSCQMCGSCAHSHCFNCYQKGKAFWAMMYKVAGLSTSPSRHTQRIFDHQLLNQPNPFNPQTEIHFRVETSGSGNLAVYDLSGQQVRLLYSGLFYGGEQSFTWNGRNDQGQTMASGIYFCRLEQGGLRQEIKMTLLK